MANRVKRKQDKKLAARIKGFEDTQKDRQLKHEQHRPGSQNRV
jgi:hypothetical protein